MYFVEKGITFVCDACSNRLFWSSYSIRDSESCTELLLERMDTSDINFKDSGGRLVGVTLQRYPKCCIVIGHLAVRDFNRDRNAYKPPTIKETK